MAILRRFALLLLTSTLAFALTACGGGGANTADGDLPTDAGSDDSGSDDTGNDDSGADPTALVDNADYSETGATLLDLTITVRPIDNPASEADPDCSFIGTGEGTTLDHVHQDVDKTDACKPEVNVIAEVNGLVDSLGEANAEMRLRGATSRLADQKSYRIKLKSKTDLWRGQRTLQVNKHPFDLSRMRNKLCFDLFIGMPNMASLRTQFLKLQVDQMDGQGLVDFGMYTHIEKVDGRFLASHGLDPEGTVYKAEFFEFLRYADNLKLADDVTYDEAAFEEILEIKEGSGDHAPLLAMLDSLNNENSDFNQMFATHFNEQNFLTWMACNILLKNLDTNAQNYFLYRPDASQIFYFLPWDYDASFDWEGQPIEVQNNAVARWNRGVSNWWGSKLQNRYLRQPGAAARLTAKIEELRSTYLTAARIQALIDSYRDVVRGRVALEPDISYMPALNNTSEVNILAEFDAELTRFPALIEAHYQEYLTTLENPMPMFMSSRFEGADVVFEWDESFDLQGDGLTYDLQVSTTPTFDQGTIVHNETGLTVTSRAVPTATFGSGEFFFRVIARDTKDPANHWQIAFESYYDSFDIAHHGVVRLVIP